MIPVYCIHLPNPERKAKIAAELSRAGFTDVTYVHAKEPVQGFTMNNMRRNPRGEFGCSLSHLRAIAAALADGQYQALFIEDDVVFSGAERLPAALAELPDDWQVLYLGGHPRSAVCKVSPHLVRVGLWSFAEGYILNRPAMLDFLSFWLNEAGQANALYDIILGTFAAEGGGYCVYAPMTHQPPGWSHIGQKQDDKRHLIEKGWKTHLGA